MRVSVDMAVLYDSSDVVVRVMCIGPPTVATLVWQAGQGSSSISDMAGG